MMAMSAIAANESTDSGYSGGGVTDACEVGENGERAVCRA